MQFINIVLFATAALAVAVPEAAPEAGSHGAYNVARSEASAIFARDQCLQTTCDPAKNHAGDGYNAACAAKNCGSCGRDHKCDSARFDTSSESSSSRKSHKGGKARREAEAEAAQDAPAVPTAKIFARDCQEVTCKVRENRRDRSNAACESMGCGTCRNRPHGEVCSHFQ